VLFGARPEPGTQQGTTALEGKIGRRLATVRVYYNWDSPFPDTDVNWFNANGYTLLLSVKSERRNHTFVRWRDIADAQPGSTLHNDIVRWADRVRSLGSTSTSPSTTSRRRPSTPAAPGPTSSPPGARWSPSSASAGSPTPTTCGS
jgi:hypothetical protein